MFVWMSTLWNIVLLRVYSLGFFKYEEFMPANAFFHAILFFTCWLLLFSVCMSTSEVVVVVELVVMSSFISIWFLAPLEVSLPIQGVIINYVHSLVLFSFFISLLMEFWKFNKVVFSVSRNGLSCILKWGRSRVLLNRILLELVNGLAFMTCERKIIST